MRAVGNQLEPFLLSELIQTDRAISKGHSLVGVSVVVSGFREFDDRNRADDRRIEATESSSKGVVDGRYVEVAMAAEMGGRENAAEDVGAAPAGAALDDEDVVANEDDGRGEHAKDGGGQDREAGYKGGGGVWRWWRLLKMLNSCIHYR